MRDLLIVEGTTNDRVLHNLWTMQELRSKAGAGKVTKVKEDGDRLQIVVRCYALPHKGQVLARCIDLDLAVIRPTLSEARNELSNQIALQVETAMELGWENLLHRPSPLTEQLPFYVLRGLHRGRGALKGLRVARYADAWRIQPGGNCGSCGEALPPPTVAAHYCAITPGYAANAAGNYGAVVALHFVTDKELGIA